jgi:hypothetical protein
MKFFQAGLAVSVSMPQQQPYFVNPSSTFSLHIESNEASGFTINIDGSLVYTETNQPGSFDYTVQAEVSGSHEIVVEATDGATVVSDNFVYVCRNDAVIEQLPENVRDGINYINDNTVTLVFHAHIKILFMRSEVLMTGNTCNEANFGRCNDSDLRYWVTITGLDQYKEHILQYIVDENLRLAEPYAEKILDPQNDSYMEMILIQI